MSTGSDSKRLVQEYWNAQSCGEVYAATDAATLDLDRQAAARFALEPYLKPFARFEEGRGKDVLEVGVGMGADHEQWALAGPRALTGVDLTDRAVEFTRSRLAAKGLHSQLQVADAERLPFADNSFDIVYSWGVLHHSPDTQTCFKEVHRVLRPGGRTRIMVYHKWSLVGLMLWARYGLMAGKPFRSLADIYANHLESPGTKCYEAGVAGRMMRDAGFAKVDVRVQLSHGDLLQGEIGQNHRGALLSVAKGLWPRPLLRWVAKGYGLYLLIEASK